MQMYNIGDVIYGHVYGVPNVWKQGIIIDIDRADEEAPYLIQTKYEYSYWIDEVKEKIEIFT